MESHRALSSKYETQIGPTQKYITIMGYLRERDLEVRGTETVVRIPSNTELGHLDYVKILSIAINHLYRDKNRQVTRVSQNPSSVNLCLDAERLR